MNSGSDRWRDAHSNDGYVSEPPPQAYHKARRVCIPSGGMHTVRSYVSEPPRCLLRSADSMSWKKVVDHRTRRLAVNRSTMVFARRLIEQMLNFLSIFFRPFLDFLSTFPQAFLDHFSTISPPFSPPFLHHSPTISRPFPNHFSKSLNHFPIVFLT